MQASFVLSLKVDLIAAPNYEIYQFYQSLIKINNVLLSLFDLFFAFLDY